MFKSAVCYPEVLLLETRFAAVCFTLFLLDSHLLIAVNTAEMHPESKKEA